MAVSVGAAMRKAVAVGWMATGRRALCTAGPALGSAAVPGPPPDRRRVPSVTSVQDLAQLMATETGRTRIGNAHLTTAIDHATSDDLELLQGLLATFVDRNKEVKRDVADDIVRRFIIEGGAAAAAEMVTDKLKYGLFPSQPAYVELLKAATDNDLAGSAKIAVFERMILDTEAASPPAECFAILSDIVEAGERPAATAASQYLLAAASDGEEVTEAQLARARAAEDALALLRAVTKRQYDQVAPSIRKMTTTLPEVWGSLLPREALAEVASWVAAGPAADTDVAEVVDEDEGAEGDVRLLPSQLHADVADALARLEAAGVSWVDVSDDGGEDDEAT
mmetsp:Transcript_34530/g.90443  ORF Transcript_34530/g.90443 Transcript_34530/m.90443 type:complete len:337 (+) Transcript_34530:33-1043(+)